MQTDQLTCMGQDTIKGWAIFLIILLVLIAVIGALVLVKVFRQRNEDDISERVVPLATRTSIMSNDDLTEASRKSYNR